MGINTIHSAEDLKKEFGTLITSTTVLNKLKWGNDRFNAGMTDGSNQPYITTDIPGVNVVNPNPTLFNDGEGLPAKTGIDVLLRNGFRAPIEAATDVSRLFKMFTDTRSPNGILFTAAQNVLSRTAVKTEASFGVGYGRTKPPDFLTGKGGGALNAGIYLPSSTLAQAGVGFLGTHLNLMGLDPTSPMSGIEEGSLSGAGLNTYSSVVSANNFDTSDSKDNRLVKIFNKRQNQQSNDSNVISYKGGPGSLLGIGSTNIKFAAGARTGRNNTGLSAPNGKSFFGQDDNPNNYSIFPSYSPEKSDSSSSPLKQTIEIKKSIFNFGGRVEDSSDPLNIIWDTGGVSGQFTKAFPLSYLDVFANLTIDTDGPLQGWKSSVYEDNLVSIGRNVPGKQWNQNTWTFTQAQLEAEDSPPINSPLEVGIPPIQDFRTKIIKSGGITTSTVLSLAPNYNTNSANVKINRGDPGKKINVFNYGLPANSSSLMPALDKLTALPMYTSASADSQLPINDFVKFRIAAISNEPDGNGVATYMHFRAFIDGFSDNYNATWNPVKYVGRGEDLYNYGGFGRSINMSFTCFAQSKAELMPMYKKLNYLASTLAPDYTSAGFMRGNIVRLTMGGYLHEQPGFITSLTYEIPQESTWEIAINATNGGPDSSVKELPHMIRVTGLQFTPIHTFLPRKPSDANNPKERYIALSDNNSSGNYSDEYTPGIPGGGGNNENIDNFINDLGDFGTSIA